MISTNGDTHLGGDDIDNLLIAIALDDMAGDAELGVADVANLGSAAGASGELVQAVRKAVIEAKIALSEGHAAKLQVALPNGEKYAREISRAQFDELIAPIIARTSGPCKQALKDAKLTADQIDEVVLVGGSTRIPAVRALLLLDVTPLSLGIEALGGVVAKIIQRNSTIPASATEHFTTGVDGQTNVAIHVLQGERELAKDCRSLARFDLKGIPPMVAGLPRIEVKFLIDANGILHVSAREQRSGKESEIKVKPTYGLTDEQVESMILASFDHAEEDIEARQLIEAKNEAETILGAVEKGKSHAAWLQLTSYEMSTIEVEIHQLKATLDGGSYRAIRAGIERLDKATRRFAEVMMDTEVMGAMKGQTMEAAGAGMGEAPTAPHPFAKAEFDERPNTDDTDPTD